jgi:hypothetical protein
MFNRHWKILLLCPVIERDQSRNLNSSYPLRNAEFASLLSNFEILSSFVLL